MARPTVAELIALLDAEDKIGVVSGQDFETHCLLCHPAPRCEDHAPHTALGLRMFARPAAIELLRVEAQTVRSGDAGHATCGTCEGCTAARWLSEHGEGKP